MDADDFRTHGPIFIFSRFAILGAIILLAMPASGLLAQGEGGQGNAISGIPVVFPADVSARKPDIAIPGTITHDIRPGAGVTTVGRLSDYLLALKGTPADSLVYILDSGTSGATTFVSAGTHANEIAGMMTAVMLVEKACVTEGRLIVLPHANNSGVTYSDPVKPGPDWIALRTGSLHPSGGTIPTAATVRTGSTSQTAQTGSTSQIGQPGTVRYFKYGARLVSPVHQSEPDPAVFVHSQGQAEQAGSEARNLDRAYPGKADGTLTQKLARAIMNLLERESVDYAFDLHEAGPTSNLVWTVVANPKNLDIAALALLDLDDRGISLKLDASEPGFRGISHYEWGNLTPALAFLVETPNPGQIPDSPDTAQLDHPVFPLWKRIGVQLEVLSAVLSACAEYSATALATRIVGLPTLAGLEINGLGAYY